MIRLAVVTAVLAIALIVLRRRARRGPNGETLRVTSRTGISRGVIAAVLEVEHRRFLVTITPSSTTLVAELDDVEPSITVETAPQSAFAAAPASAPIDAVLPADASFLDRIRARTLRTYDPALAGPHEGGR